jgi:hypothetical protein
MEHPPPFAATRPAVALLRSTLPGPPGVDPWRSRGSRNPAVNALPFRSGELNAGSRCHFPQCALDSPRRSVARTGSETDRSS